MPVLKDLTGKRFGRLTVIRYKESRGQKRYWEIVCDCGKQVILATGRLIKTRSCGCLCGERHGFARRHGQSTEYSSWCAMKDRCCNPNNPRFTEYVDRGICERWRNSFLAFLKDMGEKPSPKHTVERLNNSKGYNCGHCDDCLSRGVIANCIWATYRQQAQNTRRNKNFTFDGKTLCISEWARRIGIPEKILQDRLGKLRWSPEKAF